MKHFSVTMALAAMVGALLPIAMLHGAVQWYSWSVVVLFPIIWGFVARKMGSRLP